MATGPLQAPAGARFTCQSCTSCCRGYTVRVTEPEARRIAAHDWSKELPGAPAMADLFDVREDPDGKSFLNLAKRDGHCIFLDPQDGLCLVHKRLGVEAKPQPCRMFPFVYVETPKGLRVAMRFECERMHDARLRGAPFTEQEPEIQAIVRTGSWTPTLREQVSFDDRRKVPFALLERLAAVGADVLATPGADADRAHLRLRDLWFGTSDALGPASDAAAAARFLDGFDPTAAPAAPRGSLDEMAAATQQLVQTLADGSMKTYFLNRVHLDPKDGHLKGNEETVYTLLAILGHLERRSPSLPRLAPPLDPDMTEKTPLPLEDPALHDLLHDHLRHAAFVYFQLPGPGPFFGLQLCLVAYPIAKWIARARAAMAGRKAASLEDLNHGLVSANQQVRGEPWNGMLQQRLALLDRYCRALRFESDLPV